MTEGTIQPPPSADLQSVFAERIKFEHDVIGHRMTWLMTLNGFLVGGGAVLIANEDKFDLSLGLTATLFVISLLGSLSNASSLFSNYWGTRGIRGAGDALKASWSALDASDRDQQQAQMRLYGRDPQAFTGPSSPAPSQPLHPWLFLPGLFMVFYLCVPLVAGGISDADVNLSPMWMLVTLGLLSMFIVLPVADIRWHNRRRVISDVVGPDDDWPRRTERRQIYAAQLTEVASWLASTPDPRAARLVLKRWGLIPRLTFERYQAAKAALQSHGSAIPG